VHFFRSFLSLNTGSFLPPNFRNHISFTAYYFHSHHFNIDVFIYYLAQHSRRSNRIGSKVPVGSHHQYCWNDCGQRYKARKGSTAFTFICPFKQDKPGAISHRVQLPGH